jgi:hypothetical protein
VQVQIESNAKKSSLLPAISYFGILSMTVVEHTLKAWDFEQFLKWKLVSSFLDYSPCVTLLTNLFMDVPAPTNESIPGAKIHLSYGQSLNPLWRTSCSALLSCRC